MSIVERKFSTQEVTAVTGVDPATIQNWIRRGHIVGHRDENPIEGGGAQGKRRLFSWFATMQIAVASRLIDAGCNPGRAFRAAAGFAHSGSGESSWVGDFASKSSFPQRHPGFPFHHQHGQTVLILRGEDSELRLAKDGLLNVVSTRPAHSRDSAMMVLNLLALFETVAGRLGAGLPRSILDDIYGSATA